MMSVESRKNPHAVALARLGAAKGGSARARALSPGERREIARRAGLARARGLSGRRRRQIAERAAAARWSGRLPELIGPLFWPHALDEIRLPDRADVVLLHVIEHGSSAQVAWLRRRFGDRAIRTWIRKRRGWGIGVERLLPWASRPEIEGWWREDPNLRIWAERHLITAADLPEAVRSLLKTYEPLGLLWAEPNHRYLIAREVLTRGDEEARVWLWATMKRENVVELVKDFRGAGLAEPDRARLRQELGLTTEDLPVRPYVGMS